jgi:hypothetical protein
MTEFQREYGRTLVSESVANKMIGAKPMDYCAAGGVEWRPDFVE